MTLAALAGLGSGAIHAVSGPDHLLSLAPLSFGRGKLAWRVGLLWGVGHALGTLLLIGAVTCVAAALRLDVLATWGDRLAGMALIVTGVIGLRRWRAQKRASEAGGPACAGASARGLISIGLLHGLTGAAALLMLLPAALSENPLWQALHLIGFAFGSTAAMAALTAALAATGGKLAKQQVLLRRVPALASAGSVLLGTAWVFV